MNARTFFVACVWAGSSWAGGFAVSDQDAEATGRAGTGIAHHQSATALHFNPAGMLGVGGVEAALGVTGISPSAAATLRSEGSTARTLPGLRTPPHAYLVYGKDRLAAGVSFNAPFGGGLSWDPTWQGRYELVEMKLEVLTARAGVAYQLTPEIALGAVATIHRASVELDRRLDFVDSDGRVLLGGSGWGMGGAIGAQYIPQNPGFLHALGITAQLPSALTLEGRAHFDDVPAAFTNTVGDQRIRSALTLPAKLGVGAELNATDALRLFFDTELTFWSSFESFTVDFENEQTPDVNQPRRWQPAPTFRLGAAHALGDWALRAGLVFDAAASPEETLSPSLPDSNRLGFSLGAGRKFGWLRADVGYAFVAFLPRSAAGEAFAAHYTANAHVLALTMRANTEQR